MSNYRKLIVAVLGMVVMLLEGTAFEIPLPVQDWIVDAILGLATLFGIYQVPNTSSDGSTVRSPAWVGVIALFLTFLMMSGCASQRPEVRNLSDAIAVTSADIETAAQQVRRACGHTVPGGRCVPGALINTDMKNDLAQRLQDALDGVKLADLALDNDEILEADDRLNRARNILQLVRDSLAAAEST